MCLCCRNTSCIISIHAPHTGRDAPDGRRRRYWRRYFNPRAPYGARLRPGGNTMIINGFQSTRPIRGATGGAQLAAKPLFYFNPRAPYGARRTAQRFRVLRGGISIHAPHTGRDRGYICVANRGVEFQSTRPIRGATLKLVSWMEGKRYFNPRAPYGARPSADVRRHTDGSDFNPRAPYGARPMCCARVYGSC